MNETLCSRMDSGIANVEDKYSGLGGFLNAAKNAVFKETEGEISYDSGVEMDLKFTAGLTLTGPPPPGPNAALQPVADPTALIALVDRQPFQSRARNSPKASDITTLMIGGSQASKLGEKSTLEALRAIAEDRGYSEAPVSVLYLEGRPPDLVFEKANNTFSKRHHLRIWLRPDQYQGRPVWVCAATHDTSINFSAKDRTFIHRIDAQIDMERFESGERFVADREGAILVDSGSSECAAGDKLTTDGKMAVVILK